MTKSIHERPREKLRMHGVASLSRAELIQLIIGSGTAHYPVPSLARKVHEAMMSNSDITVHSLRSIPGLGVASASRIVAAIELGKRKKRHGKLEVPRYILSIFAESKRLGILFETLDANGVKIKQHFLANVRSKSQTLVARKLCAQALADKAYGMNVFIGSRNHSLEAAMFETTFIEDLKNLTFPMRVRLRKVYIANMRSHKMLYDGEA